MLQVLAWQAVASAETSASFWADGLVVLFALSFAAWVAASGCAWVLGASADLVSDCCACTGTTALIRMSAIADAIGVFLSFMNFPLDWRSHSG